MSDFDGIFSSVEQQLAKTVRAATDESVERITTLVADKLIELNRVSRATAKLVVTSSNGQSTLTGLKHKQLEDLIKMVGQDLPLLMVGMAGTGKTHAAEQVAQALNLPFYAMSVGAQTSKSDIIGFMHAGGEYVGTLFRQAYEHGGVFLMDEVDAGNANVLIQVNAALSNHYCAFPDGMVKRHPDFRFIGTANTYGNGANRMYVGRNQLDAATLDRFTVMNWDIDSELEGAMVSGIKDGAKWHKAIVALRLYIEDNQIRTLVTPRATVRGAKLLSSGFGFEAAAQAAILNSVPADKQASALDVLRKAWKDTK